ncbi:MAG: hypothetical protein ABH842_03810 [Candidatus Micrarchaeota archaeon]
MHRQVGLVQSGGNSGNKFRQFTLRAEGIQVLPQNTVENMVHTLHRRSAHSILSRYSAAKKTLQEQFGGVVELVQVHNGAIRIAARLEFLTDHLRLDEKLHSLVVGMGFDLVLHHRVRPTEEHVYIISESRYKSTADFSAVAHITENLLRLAKMLEQYTVELPDNVVRLPIGETTPTSVRSCTFENRRVALGT